MLKLFENRMQSFTTILIALSLVCITGESRAEVVKVVAKSSGVLGNYGDSNYIWVNADMHGTVKRDDDSTGSYRVPITLIYPDRTPDSIGFVDVINSARFAIMRDGDAPDHKRTNVRIGQLMMGDYLWRQNYSYLSVIWYKAVTDSLGTDYGIIEMATDGYQILSDAALVLRTAPAIEGHIPFQLKPATHIVNFGFSQSGSLLRAYENTGNNIKPDGSLYYDGMLSMVGGRRGSDSCRELNNDATPRTAPNFPKSPSFNSGSCSNGKFKPGSKYISLQSETEIDIFANHLERGQTSNYRQYELAGAAHLYPSLEDTRKYGHFAQNPVDLEPSARATLAILADWVVNDIKPPPSTYIDGQENEEGQFVILRDADGNASGGIRLPHMPTVLPNGKKAGAPLGTYKGVNSANTPLAELGPEASGWNWVMRMISGSFQPFSQQDLSRRYPTLDHYVSRVTQAAGLLLKQRLILPEDHKTYIKAAEMWKEPAVN